MTDQLGSTPATGVPYDPPAHVPRRAEVSAEILLHAALKAHHDWHLGQTEADQHGIVPAEAYAESLLCIQTTAALQIDADESEPTGGMNVNDVKSGMRVKIGKLGDTTGFMIAPRHIAVRREGVYGVVRGYVPGHGGDVWFVGHEPADGVEDGEIGAYMFTEMEPA